MNHNHAADITALKAHSDQVLAEADELLPENTEQLREHINNGCCDKADLLHEFLHASAHDEPHPVQMLIMLYVAFRRIIELEDQLTATGWSEES